MGGLHCEICEIESGMAILAIFRMRNEKRKKGGYFAREACEIETKSEISGFFRKGPKNLKKIVCKIFEIETE